MWVRASLAQLVEHALRERMVMWSIPEAPGGRPGGMHALSRWPKGYGSQGEFIDAAKKNQIAPREALTPDLEVNSLTR